MDQLHRAMASLDLRLPLYQMDHQGIPRAELERYVEAMQPFYPGDQGKGVSDDGWFDYEGYMKAKIIKGEPGEIGLVLVCFAPGLEFAASLLHSHDYSHRQVLVLQGEGVYHHEQWPCSTNPRLAAMSIQAGSLLHFNARTLHTFTTEESGKKSGKESGLVVLSRHIPFVPLDSDLAYTPIEKQPERKQHLVRLYLEEREERQGII